MPASSNATSSRPPAMTQLLVRAKYASPLTTTASLIAQWKPSLGTTGNSGGRTNDGWYPPKVRTNWSRRNHTKNAKPPVSWQSGLSTHELSVSCAWIDSTPSAVENLALSASSTEASSSEPAPASGGG